MKYLFSDKFIHDMVPFFSLFFSFFYYHGHLERSNFCEYLLKKYLIGCELFMKVNFDK